MAKTDTEAGSIETVEISAEGKHRVLSSIGTFRLG